MMYYPFENKNQENNNCDESDEFKVYNKQSSFKDYKNISKATPQNIKLKGIMREATITQKIQKKMVIFDQTDGEIESIRNKYNKKQSSKSYKVLPFVDEISTCKMKNSKTTMPDEKDSKHVKYCTATDTGTPTDRSSTNSRNESLHSYKESYSSDINEATRIPNIVKNSNKLKNYQAKKEQNFDENLIQKSNHNEKENKPAKEPKIAENINELNFLAHQKFKILKESLSAYENIMKKYNAIINQKEEEIKCLNSKLDEGRKEKDQLLASKKELITECRSKDDKIKDQEKKICDLNQEKNRLDNLVKEYERKERKEIKNRKQLECEMKAKGEENTLLQKNLKELEFELNSTKENIKVLKENENLLQKENEDRAIRINELLIKYSSLKSEYEEYKLDNIMYASIFVLFLINLFIKYRNKEDINKKVFKYLDQIREKMEGNNRKKTNSNQRKNSNSKKMDDSETYSENLNLSEDMNLSKEINICKLNRFTEKNNDCSKLQSFYLCFILFNFCLISLFIANKNNWPKTVSSDETPLSSTKKTEVEIVMLS